MQATLTPTGSFQAVLERNNEFLGLFPHRFDFIWAERSAPGERPQWQTESRYPLSDRLLLQGQQLYGVRFGATTRYLMIDVDITSPYHPKRDRLAISRLVEALEAIGLVSFPPCTSSYSGGLHLYFPFETAQKCWDLAFAAQTLLQRAGFKVAPGYLELFSNPKLYAPSGAPNLYAAHRLPLQEPGSYLLTEEWQLRSTSQAEFVRLWHYVAARNEIQEQTIAELVQNTQRFQYGLSQSANKFLSDLNTEIEKGWTDYGQTNRLLGRIAMRSYIFGHYLQGSSIPLEGRELVHDIVQTAQRLSGYREWCRHQHEIDKRAEDWARCVENSRYFPYGYGKSQQSYLTKCLSQPDTHSWNQQQEESARVRIHQAVACLLEHGCLPSTTTARFKALVKEGIGGGTLYRHRDLWHPAEFQVVDQVFDENKKNLTTPKAGSQSKNDYDPALKSLLCETARNQLPSGTLGDRKLQESEPDRNADTTCSNPPEQHPWKLSFQDQQQQWLESYHKRMQGYLTSGDPILMAEAQASVMGLRQVEAAEDEFIPPTTAPPPPKPIAPAKELGTEITSSQSQLINREQFQLVVEAIAYHRARLGWSEPLLRQKLMDCTGKPGQALLSDRELVNWLTFLEQQIP